MAEPSTCLSMGGPWTCERSRLREENEKMREVLKSFVPGRIPPGLADHQIYNVCVTVGELRRARALSSPNPTRENEP